MTKLETDLQGSTVGLYSCRPKYNRGEKITYDKCHVDIMKQGPSTEEDAKGDLHFDSCIFVSQFFSVF